MQLYCLCGARFYRLFSTEQQPHLQINGVLLWIPTVKEGAALW